MLRTGFVLLLIAASTMHCDKSGTRTPEEPDPVPEGTGPHPEIERELPGIAAAYEEKAEKAASQSPANWRTKVLWMAATGGWSRVRHPLSGIIVGRSFLATAIVQVEPEKDGDCYTVGLEGFQELLENGRFSRTVYRNHPINDREITCSTANVASYGWRPGGGGPSGDAGADPGTPPDGGGGPDAAAGYKAGFEAMYKMMAPTLKETVAKIEVEQADHQKWRDGLRAASKKSAEYAKLSKQYDEVTAQAEQFKANHAAYTSYYEATKDAPSQDDHQRVAREGQTLIQAGSQVLIAYMQLKAARSQVP